MPKRSRDEDAVELNGAVATDDIELKKSKKKRKRSEDDGAEAVVSKKDKKKSKDKKDKKETEVVAAEPEQMNVDSEVVAEPVEEKAEKKSKKEKKEKKSKDKEEKSEKKKDKEQKSEKKEAKEAKSEEKKDKEEKSEKKKKNKDEKKKNKKSEATEPEPAQTNGNAATENGETANEEADNQEEEGKGDRHIVFVGNLPYTATAESITQHFSSLNPIHVRCLTQRDEPTKCRGIAFVEFGRVWHMRTCLDKFHHTTFDDGKSPARKINVELTAGGGGKTSHRKEKIKEKNRKLDENREKRIVKEQTAKLEKKGDGEENQDIMHPSRRAMLSKRR